MKSIPPIGSKVVLTGTYRESLSLDDYIGHTGVVETNTEPMSSGMYWVSVNFNGYCHGIYICNLSFASNIRRP